MALSKLAKIVGGIALGLVGLGIGYQGTYNYCYKLQEEKVLESCRLIQSVKDLPRLDIRKVRAKNQATRLGIESEKYHRICNFLTFRFY